MAVSNRIAASPPPASATGSGPTGAAGGSLGGTYPNPTIAASAITTTEIADGTIVTGDLNAAAGITSGQLAGSIAASKISGTAVTAADTGTVTSTMILNGTILDADVNASAAIAATKVAGTAVTAADTGTVTSTMLLDGTILNADVNASAAIAYTKVQQAIGPDRAAVNAGLYQKTTASPSAQFVGITALKPIFYPIDLFNVPSLALSQFGVRVSTLLNASTVGIAIYTATYASAGHVSATLVAQLNAAISGTSAGMVTGAVTTGAAGSGAAPYTFDFTANRYLIGVMASDTGTLKLYGVAFNSVMTGLGIISWTGTARSSATDWPSSFTEAANVAAISATTQFPIVDLMTATGAFFL